ncbi:MAG: hypothetical protein J6I80_00360 [Clostridia bacterium]|nr:hypothetical protein [Clostridia bacterium]
MNELSALDILRILLRKFWLIAIVSLVCGIISFVYCTFLVTPVYSATASIFVSNGGVVENPAQTGKVSSSDLSASAYIKETCKDLLTTKNMLSLVAEECGLEYNYSDLKGMITLKSRSDDSLLLDITVKGINKEDLVTIANTFADCSQVFIKDTLPLAYVAPVEYSSSVAKVSPRTVFSTLIAVAVGAFLVVVPLLFVAFNDNIIKGEESIKNKYDISVLGVVPDFNSSSKGGYYNG